MAWLLAMSLLVVALAWPAGKAEWVAPAALFLGMALMLWAWRRRD